MDDEKEVLRAAVTEASSRSAAALSRVQESLFAFRACLAGAFVAPHVQKEFENVLDVCDAQMHALNATTHSLAARLRACGSAVQEVGGEDGAGGGGSAPPAARAALERSAVGKAASVPLGELQALLDGLEAGHARHVAALGAGGGSSLRSPSGPPPARRAPPPPLQPAGTASIAQMLEQLAKIRRSYAAAHGGLSPAAAVDPLSLLASPSAGGAAHSPPRVPAPVPAPSAGAAAHSPPRVPTPVPAPTAEGLTAAAALSRLKEERRELELELLQAHKAINALQGKLGKR
jgi:hypothetical protein